MLSEAMELMQLIQVTVFLAAAAIGAPLGRALRMGSVIGYLAAGIVIGPFVFGSLYGLNDVEHILKFGEFGVVMLLFVIGLELRPVRLWSMRSSIFGLGTLQLVTTSFVLGTIALAVGLSLAQALFVGLALSLSSTAFALQVLEERNELTTRHGRLAFSILLFQDLAAIPLIALVPLFATGGEETGMDLKAAGLAIVTILGVVVVGRFLLSRLYRLVAATGVREAMTASALLTVVGVALVMEAAGLSAALGAFIAGALLADSEYRHQIEADIAPFEGLLLGLFFIAVGMSIDLTLCWRSRCFCWPLSSDLSRSRPRCCFCSDDGGACPATARSGSASSSVRAASSPSCCLRPAPSRALSAPTFPHC